MRLLILVVLVMLPLCASARDYKYSTTAGLIDFAWSVDGDKLHIKLSAKTTGWIGIAFNPSMAMGGATFFIARARGEQARVSTDFGTGLYAHSRVDDMTDVSEVSGKEANGTTEIAFTIPLKFKNPQYKPIEVNQETTVLLAYGIQDDDAVKHRYRAKLLVNLATGGAKIVKEG